LQARLSAYRIVAIVRLYSNGRLLALPANVIVGYKLMAMTNDLAHYDLETITALKSFIVQVPATDPIE
jgi:hypothetical protein